jgi:hypothetical protein
LIRCREKSNIEQEPDEKQPQVTLAADPRDSRVALHCFALALLALTVFRLSFSMTWMQGLKGHRDMSGSVCSVHALCM